MLELSDGLLWWRYSSMNQKTGPNSKDGILSCLSDRIAVVEV
jgi:hypothetical protein